MSLLKLFSATAIIYLLILDWPTTFTDCYLPNVNLVWTVKLDRIHLTFVVLQSMETCIKKLNLTDSLDESSTKIYIERRLILCLMLVPNVSKHRQWALLMDAMGYSLCSCDLLCGEINNGQPLFRGHCRQSAHRSLASVNLFVCSRYNDWCLVCFV